MPRRTVTDFFLFGEAQVPIRDPHQGQITTEREAQGPPEGWVREEVRMYVRDLRQQVRDLHARTEALEEENTWLRNRIVGLSAELAVLTPPSEDPAEPSGDSDGS